MHVGELAPTPRVAQAPIADGLTAPLVPSFARGAGDDDIDLVLHDRKEPSTTRLRLIDDERRPL